MESKEDIRKIVRGYRAALSKDDVVMMSIMISEKLLQIEAYKQASCVYGYVDCQNEVMTKPIIRRALSDGKRVALPKIHGKEMEFHYIKSYDDLKLGSYGILEPEGCPIAIERNALLIMPGLAFDRKNHRIGYGGGYYDRYLKRSNQHYKVALAYHFQIFDSIPHEKFDICPDLILTDET